MLNRKNHELFRLYYGDFEYQRLKPIFETEPEDLRRGEDWDVPQLVEADYLIRMLLIAGVGSIKFLQKLMSDQKVCNQVKSIILIENDPKVISHLINHPHFEAFITHDSVKVCFQETDESIKPNLFRILKAPNFSDIMMLGCVYFNKTGDNEADNKFYSHLDSYLRETVEHILNNYGRIDDSLDGVRATFLNGKRIFDCPGIEDLRGFYEGRPAIVCGAGPSLDLAIPHLLKNRNKAIILAADAAVKPLMAAGITPNFCTSIERLNKFQLPFWKDLDPKTCQLVCFPVVHPEVLSEYKGQIRFVYRNYSYFGYFQKSWPKGILGCGGSTTNLAVRLADYLGCNQVILAGVDHAYEKREDGLYRSHCLNVGDPSWAEFMELKDFQNPSGRNHAPSFPRPSNNGGEVYTNYTYYLWSKEFAEEIRNLGKPIIDTSLNGVKMDQIPYKPLEEIFSGLNEIEIPPAPITRAHYYRKWEHKTLSRSIAGWIKLAERIKKTANEYPNVQVLRYLGDLYNIKFVKEDMFISFVVQNCAAEYYRLQNDYHALKPVTEALEGHVDNLTKKMELFLKVLVPLQDMIKAYGSIDQAA